MLALSHRTLVHPHPFEQYGYTIIRPIEVNARFASYLVRRGDAEYFAKAAIGDHARQLENEVWFALTLARAGETTPSLSVLAPRIDAFGRGWFVCDALTSSALVTREDARAPESVAPHAPALARILADLDRAFADTPHMQPTVEESDSAPVTNLLRRVDRWVTRPLEEGIIAPERVRDAKALIEARTSLLEPRLQHGDFVPWHIFQTGPSIYTLVDGEHASLLKPRYYDLAYLYSRLWTRVHAAVVARTILREFLAATGLERSTFFASFLPVLTQRALGMHFDALNDRSENEYVAEAQELLTLCLREDVDALG